MSRLRVAVERVALSSSDPNEERTIQALYDDLVRTVEFRFERTEADDADAVLVVSGRGHSASLGFPREVGVAPSETGSWWSGFEVSGNRELAWPPSGVHDKIHDVGAAVVGHLYRLERIKLRDAMDAGETEVPLFVNTLFLHIGGMLTGHSGFVFEEREVAASELQREAMELLHEMLAVDYGFQIVESRFLDGRWPEGARGLSLFVNVDATVDPVGFNVTSTGLPGSQLAIQLALPTNEHPLREVLAPIAAQIASAYRDGMGSEMSRADRAVSPLLERQEKLRRAEREVVLLRDTTGVELDHEVELEWPAVTDAQLVRSAGLLSATDVNRTLQVGGPAALTIARIHLSDDPQERGVAQRLNVVLLNNTSETRFLTGGRVKVHDFAELDIWGGAAGFSLSFPDWEYQVDLEGERTFVGHHSVEPGESINFDVVVGRKNAGGPRRTLFRCSLALDLDLGMQIHTSEFVLVLDGPTVPNGMRTQDTYGRAVERALKNLSRADRIGWDLRPMISDEFAEALAQADPDRWVGVPRDLLTHPVFQAEPQETHQSVVNDAMRTSIVAALQGFGVDAGARDITDTERLYVWRPDGSTADVAETPVPSRLKISDASDDLGDRPRILPLAVVPKLRDNEVQVLVKQHQHWGPLLPSREVSAFEVAQAGAILREDLCAVLEDSSDAKPVLLGSALSYKRSVTSGSATAFIFPVYGIQLNKHTASVFEASGDSYSYSSKKEVHELEDSANADVFVVLDRLAPASWSAFRDFVPGNRTLGERYPWLRHVSTFVAGVGLAGFLAGAFGVVKSTQVTVISGVVTAGAAFLSSELLKLKPRSAWKSILVFMLSLLGALSLFWAFRADTLSSVERTERLIYQGQPPVGAPEIGNGVCSRPSNATRSRADSARCNEGNVCFEVNSARDESDPNRRLFECPHDWDADTPDSTWLWSSPTPTEALRSPQSVGSESLESAPTEKAWGIELANGLHCQLKAGGTSLVIANRRMDYFCYDPSGDLETRWSDGIVGGVVGPLDPTGDVVFVQYTDLEEGRNLVEIAAVRLVF